MAAAAELSQLRNTIPYMHQVMNENTSLKMERGALLHELHLKNQDTTEVARLRAEVQALKAQLARPHCADVGVQFVCAPQGVDNSTQTHFTNNSVAVGVQTSPAAVPCTHSTTQTSPPRSKSVGVQSAVKTVQAACQTDAFACPEPQGPPSQMTLNCHAWMQKLWLLCTTVLPNLKPGYVQAGVMCSVVTRLVQTVCVCATLCAAAALLVRVHAIFVCDRREDVGHFVPVVG